MAPGGRAYHQGMVAVAGGAVLVLVGAALAVVGILGLAARLPRNRWAGVRTPASLVSDGTFRVANRVSGPGIVVSGVLVALAGAAVAGLEGLPRVVVTMLLLSGGVALMIAAGALGARAAAVAPPVAPHARCADCTGCELMDSLSR